LTPSHSSYISGGGIAIGGAIFALASASACASLLGDFSVGDGGPSDGGDAQSKDSPGPTDTGGGTEGGGDTAPGEAGAPAFMATQVSCGLHQTCALNGAGRIYCWGGNAYGQLGVDPAVAPISDTPRIVPDYGMFTPATAGQVVSGGAFVCAIESASTHRVWCWGANDFGQLGNGTSTPIANTPYFQPRLVMTDEAGTTPLADVAELAAGPTYACAVLSSGDVDCWGDNSSGNLGQPSGPSPHLDVATQVGSLGARAIGTGDHSACVLQALGLTCWGTSSSGEAGAADAGVVQPSPPGSNYMLSTGLAATAVDVGFAHACAIDTSQNVECWGSNSLGQLGQSPTLVSSSATSVAVSNFGSAVQLGAGANTTCAIKQDASLWCWGGNEAGQLGQGGADDTDPHPLPAQVHGGAGTWKAISIGSKYACAIGATAMASDPGPLYCWGSHLDDKLGNPSADNADQQSPVPVSPN